ncbi:MAG: DUF2267 domain-containing protein [Candidatus Aquicultorales bacterium]
MRRVQEEGRLPDQDSTKEAISAVLTTLHSRIMEGEADDVEATLPSEIKKLWEGSTGIKAHAEPAAKFDKNQFIERVQRKAQLSTAREAEDVSKAVLKVLKEAIPEGEVRDLESQLPQDLREFVRAA